MQFKITKEFIQILNSKIEDKHNQWILEKFYTHKFEDLPENATVLEHPDKIGDELKIALQKSKISTSNAAIAIPVTLSLIHI